MGLFKTDAAKAAWANASFTTTIQTHCLYCGQSPTPDGGHWARCQTPARLAGIAYQASINNHADTQDLATQAAAAYLASGS